MDQSNITREFRKTQVRFCDADLSDDPRDSRSRRFYFGLEKKLERIPKVQTRSISPKSTAISVRWNGALLLRRDCWGSEYLEYHADFGDRMVGYNPIRGCVLLAAEVPLVKWHAALCPSSL
jgi:hypothetical protein